MKVLSELYQNNEKQLSLGGNIVACIEITRFNCALYIFKINLTLKFIHITNKCGVHFYIYTLFVILIYSYVNNCIFYMMIDIYIEINNVFELISIHIYLH